MADYSISNMTQPLAVNNGSDPRALALKKFAGEILASYYAKAVVSDKIYRKSIKAGKSHMFPLTGRASAEYFDTKLNPAGMKTAERVITIDALMIASTIIPNFEQKLGDFDARNEYTDALGKALGRACELHTFIELLKVSHASKVISDDDQFDGRWIANDKLRLCTGGAANQSELAGAVFEALLMAVELMDDAELDTDEGLNAALPLSSYNALVASAASNGLNYMNRDNGGTGSVATGKIPFLAGCELFKAPKIPKNSISGTGINKYHYGDFTRAAGVVFKKEAVGRLDLMNVAVENQYSIEYQGDIVVAKLACGMGGLRPEASVALELDTVTNQTI